MELKNILKKLDGFSFRPIIEADSTLQVHTYKRIKAGQTAYAASCLYIGYASELPHISKNSGIANMICIEDVPLSHGFFDDSGKLNLYLFSGDTELRVLIDKVADIMIGEAELSSAMRCLYDSVYQNRGLQHLVDIAAELIENPLFISDNTYKVIAKSKDAESRYMHLEEEKPFEYIPLAVVTEMKKDGLITAKGGSNRAHIVSRNSRNENWIFKAIEINSIVVALIAIVDTFRPFREIDREFAELLANTVSIELSKSEFYKDNRGIMYNYFLADILSKQMQDPVLISQRIKALDWKVYDYFNVAVVINDSEKMNQSKLQYVAGQLRQIIAGCRWTYYRDDLVLLWSRPKGGLLSSEKSQLESFMAKNGLYIGISGSFHSLSDAESHYRQAFTAAETGIYMNHGEKFTFYYPDMIPYCIAHMVLKRNHIEDFYSESVLELVNYDRENGTNMLETLNKYLLYVGNPVKAADELHIHRNTLLYRLNKIKEQFGIDLNDGNERFNIQLYLKFAEYASGSW